MKKQTAVEWLVNELNQKIDFIPMDKWDMIRDIIQKAKVMEKEKAFEIFEAGQKSMEEGGKGFEQYYNKTYKGGEQ